MANRSRQIARIVAGVRDRDRVACLHEFEGGEVRLKIRSGKFKDSSYVAAGRVGGVGGTDSQNVNFRASPDETVTISTPEQMRGQSRPLVLVSINNQSKAQVESKESKGPNGEINFELLIVDAAAPNVVLPSSTHPPTAASAPNERNEFP